MQQGRRFAENGTACRFRGAIMTGPVETGRRGRMPADEERDKADELPIGGDEDAEARKIRLRRSIEARRIFRTGKAKIAVERREPGGKSARSVEPMEFRLRLERQARGQQRARLESLDKNPINF